MTTKRKYARLTPATWATIEGLWASGSATLPEIAERFGVSARAIQSHMSQRGIGKGSAAEALAAEVRSGVLSRTMGEPDDLVARAAAIREGAVQGAEKVERLLHAALDAAAADPGKVFALAASAKALALAAQTLERLHKLKRSALGLGDDDTLSDELPTLLIEDLSASDIAAMREDDEEDDGPKARQDEDNEVVLIT